MASSSASRRRSSPPLWPSGSWARLRTSWSRGRRRRSCAGKTWSLEHDPEKWEPVFGKDHAQPKSWTLIRSNRIKVEELSFMLVLDHVGKTYPNGVHALEG